MRTREAAARDAALDLFEQYRAGILAEAKDVAIRLARLNGRVTSSEVIRELKERFPEAMARYDRRFMGGVFRGPMWERVGFTNSGSHCRPVSVWRIREAA